MKKVPKHVAERFGSARAFRARARTLVRELDKQVEDLRLGCAYFPTGSKPLEKIAEQVSLLRTELSVKKWGR